MDVVWLPKYDRPSQAALRTHHIPAASAVWTGLSMVSCEVIGLLRLLLGEGPRV